MVVLIQGEWLARRYISNTKCSHRKAERAADTASASARRAVILETPNVVILIWSDLQFNSFLYG